MSYSGRPMVSGSGGAQAAGVAEPLIERGEIVALLFNVSEIVFQVTQIRELLEEDDGEEEVD